MGKRLNRAESRVFVEFGGPLDLYPLYGEKVENVRQRLALDTEEGADFEQYWQWALDAISVSGVGNPEDERGGPYVVFNYRGDLSVIPTFFFKQDNNGDTTVVSFDKPFLSPDRTTYHAACVDIVTDTRADTVWFIENGVQVREVA